MLSCLVYDMNSSYRNSPRKDDGLQVYSILNLHENPRKLLRWVKNWECLFKANKHIDRAFFQGTLLYNLYAQNAHIIDMEALKMLMWWIKENVKKHSMASVASKDL